MPKPPITVEQLVSQFGPAKLINRKQADKLAEAGKRQHILCLLIEEGDDDGIPTYTGVVGHHLVDVFERYEMGEPMPIDLSVTDPEGDGFFGDGALPSP